MNRTQAEAIADAMLARDPERQERLRLRREAEARQLREGRKLAVVALVAMAVGGVIAYLTDHHFATGALYTALAALGLSRLHTTHERRRGEAGTRARHKAE